MPDPTKPKEMTLASVPGFDAPVRFVADMKAFMAFSEMVRRHPDWMESVAADPDDDPSADPGGRLVMSGEAAPHYFACFTADAGIAAPQWQDKIASMPHPAVGAIWVECDLLMLEAGWITRKGDEAAPLPFRV